LSFNSGAWKSQIPEPNPNGGTNWRIDLGTYTITGDLIAMSTVASSCQPLIEITNPVATFICSGDRMTMNWQSDPTSAFPPEILHLRRVVTLSDVEAIGCFIPSTFWPNPVTPVP
jgi:hypothetical protein